MTCKLPNRTEGLFGRIIPILLSLLFCGITSATTLSAQESITFDRLKELLDPYFAPELVGDVEAALPKADFAVWGFDVGDYSGDGYNDLIVSIRMTRDRGKNMRIYHFIDIEGILEVVREETVEFFELPIEVGVTIGDGNAYVLAKREEGGWDVWGRRYSDGVIMLVDIYSTETGEALVHQKYRHYQDLFGWDRYIRIRNESEVFRADFLTVPSYRRGRHVSAGYAQTATATMAEHILQGAYYREGESDLTLHVRSAWDDEYLYYHIIVDDDAFVPNAEEVDSIGDRVEIWIDAYIYGDRLTGGSRRSTFRMASDTNIYGLMIHPGDLADREPSISVVTTNVFDERQNRSTSKIRAIAGRHDSGWSLRIRVPFSLLGFSDAPIDEENPLVFGSSVVVHDLDNPYRPNELTVMTMSHNFDRDRPATFGEVIIVPGTVTYGESRNIFFQQVRERLEEIGY